MSVFHVSEKLEGRDSASSSRNSSPRKHIQSATGSIDDLAGVASSTDAAALLPVCDAGEKIDAKTMTMRREVDPRVAAAEYSSTAGAMQAATDDAATTPVLEETARQDSAHSIDVGEEDADGSSVESSENQKPVAAGPAAPAVATEGGDAELPPEINAISTSWSGVGESSGEAPIRACDSNNGSTRKRESQPSQGKAWSERKMMRKIKGQSVATLGHRSGGNGSANGGSDGAEEAPANPRHIQVQNLIWFQHTLYLLVILYRVSCVSLLDWNRCWVKRQPV